MSRERYVPQRLQHWREDVHLWRDWESIRCPGLNPSLEYWATPPSRTIGFSTARSIGRVSPSGWKSRRAADAPARRRDLPGVKGGAASCGSSWRVRCRARRIYRNRELNFNEPPISYGIGRQRTDAVTRRSQPRFFRFRQSPSVPTDKPPPFQQGLVHSPFG